MMLHVICRRFLYASAFWVLCCGGQRLSAAPQNISFTGTSGSVFAYRVAPNGSRVVFDGGFPDPEIRSAPIAGGSLPLTLNPPLPPGGILGLRDFSPDSNLVTYSSDQGTLGVQELFVVSVFGGITWKVNDTLVAGGNVDGWSHFSGDSSRILYIADQDADERQELYVSSLTNGVPNQPIKLNGTLTPNGDVTIALFSPDNSRVIYHADQVSDEVFELYSVPSAGGLPAIKLNGALVPGGSVESFGINGSSTRVAYTADQQTDGVVELYSVPIAGGAATKLNGALAAGGNVSRFGFTPDNNRVLYLADQAVDERHELYSVPATGGAATKLNGALPAGGAVSNAVISPTSTRTIYVADQSVVGKTELYSVPTSGGAAVKLNGAMGSNQDVVPNSISFSVDGSRVLYRADQDTDGVNEVYSVASTGGTPVKLNGPLAAGGNVMGFDFPESFYLEPTFSPDGSRVLYIADQEVDQRFEMYLVPSLGGTPVKVNGPLFPGTSVSEVAPVFTADGSRIVFMAQHEFDQTAEVYSRVVQIRSVTGGGYWDDSAAWNQSVSPDEVMQVTINTASTIVASGPFSRSVNELRVGGGTSTSIVTLTDNASINAINGITLSARGVLRGDGQIIGEIQGASFGELRAGAGEQLRIGSSSFTNSGVVAAVGSGLAGAEIEFDGTLTNSASTGLVTGQHAVLRAASVVNQGSLLLSGGANNVFGDINNVVGGRIAVSGGATATFYDDVVQNGILQVMKIGSTNSVATFAGSFTGSGGSAGGGDIFFLGDLRPGSSPAVVSFGNNVALGGSATLQIELGGTSPGTQHDLVQVGGELALGGTLQVSLINNFAPVLGDVFNILDWSSVLGTFAAMQLPTLSGGLLWNTGQLYTNGVLSVAASAVLAGDFNHDGTVDAADYVVWRKNDGAQAGYAEWRANFGQTAGAGSGSAGGSLLQATTPEPPSAILLLGALFAVGASRRR